MNNRIMISLLTAAVVFAQSPLSFVQAADDTSASLKPEYSLSGNILPVGIPGLPDDYDLPEREMDEKVQMMEHDVLQALGSMTADEDYRDGLVYTYAETEEEATAYAEAFNGTIKVYSEKIVTIELPSDVSVLQAVSASSDPTCTKLPCVSPVYKIYLDPREKDGSLSSVSDGSGDSLFSVGGSSGTSGLSYEDHILNDYVNDPYLLHPEELYNDNDRQYQWHHDMVNTWEAWTYGYGNPAIKVGVIDTGVFADHEDLKGNVKAQYDYCTYDDSDENYVTDNHGTHVAGIIGASVNNGKGGSGIAPGVSIYSYNVFVYDGGAYSDDQVRAIRDCADEGMDVVNMSLGGIGLDTDMLAAVTYAWEKGVTIFASMGNDSTSIRKYPACYDHVVAVSNLARDGLRSASSTYGSWCDLAAPGTDIMSTVCVMNGSTVTNKTNAYESFTGTSMSTPVATGVAALYMSRYGNPGPDQMEKLMKKYSQKCSAKGCGALIDAGKLMASGSVPVPDMRLYTEYGSYDVDRSGSSYEDITEFTLSDPLSSTGPLSRSLVYTLDGKNPTSDSHISYTGTVDLLSLGLAGGSVVILKAAVLDETGKIGKILSVKLKLPADSVTEAANKAENVGIVVYDDTEKKPITKCTMSYSGDENKDYKAFNAVMTDSLGNELALDQVKHKWITSDPSVVFLSEKDSGVVYLYPGKKGKAKITLKLLDGSGKTAVCNVTVEQSVTGISISGQDSIAPGKSASFKASVYPTDAKNKKVEWAVTDGSGVTISSAGKVTVPLDISADAYFTVTAKALDGSGVTATKTVYVKSSTETLDVALVDGDFTTKDSDSQAGVKKISFNNNSLKQIVLSSADISSNSYDDDQTYLTSKTDNAIPVEWKTSNPKVVKVNGSDISYSSDVTLTAQASGKAVITCRANDGSGKSVKINVTVINPVSYVSLNMDQDMSVYAIAKGYSRKNKVYLGDSYGKPGITKVDWDYSIYDYSNIFDSSTGNNENKAYNEELTQTIKDSDLVSLNNSGVLKVSKEWKDGIYRVQNNYYNSDAGTYHYEIKDTYMIRVTATATDGSGFNAYKDYVVTPPVKKVTSNLDNYKRPLLYPYSSSEFSVVPEDEDGNALFMSPYDLVVTNSNPKCGSIYNTGPLISGGFIMSVPVCDAKKKKVRGVVGYYYYTGTTSVKISFNDGSGKSVKYKIIRNWR